MSMKNCNASSAPKSNKATLQLQIVFEYQYIYSADQVRLRDMISKHE